MRTAKEHNDNLVTVLRDWQQAYLSLRASAQTPLQYIELTVKSEQLIALGQILSALAFQDAVQPPEEPQPEAFEVRDVQKMWEYRD